MNFTIEQNIVLQSCYLTKKNGVSEQFETVKDQVNWDLIVKLAAKNRVLGLLHNNLLKTEILNDMPIYYIQMLEDFGDSTSFRNDIKLEELSKLRIAAKQIGIPFAPVKGGYLIDNIYKNRRLRATNDIDALIKRKDIQRVHDMMSSNGYLQGEYDKANNAVLKSDRNKKMLYKTKMYNLLPYIKIDHNNPNNIVFFDLSFALDFSLNSVPIDEMLDMAISTEKGIELLPEHFLIHICCHHYREASNVAWIMLGKDFNLIKFCDVREFILQKMDSDSITKAIQFAKKHGLEKAIYFTIYFIREIYNDGYETEILESLGIEDEAFLYQFGEKDYGKLQTRKKDFWTSLFSDNNKDEIVQEPKYKSLI